MPVTYLVQFDVIPQQRARLLSLVTGVLDAMLAQPRTISVWVPLRSDRK